MRHGNRGPMHDDGAHSVDPARRARRDARRPTPLTERCRLLAAHAVAFQVLAERGKPSLARGAALVATVAACRMASTPAASAAEFTAKCRSLGNFITSIEVARRGHVAALVEAALATEAEGRMRAGLPLTTYRLDGWASPEAAADGTASVLAAEGAMAELDRSEVDVERYAAAASADDVDAVLAESSRTVADMIASVRRGQSVDGVLDRLEEGAFALCAMPSDTLARREDLERPLDILARTLERRRPLAAAIIRARLTLDKQRWGGLTRGEA